MQSKRSSRLFCSIIVILFCGLLFIDCKPKPKERLSEKKIYLPLASNVKSLDPAMAEDLYSNKIIQEVYEGLYEYGYLKRPVELQPRLAAAMPKISKNGRVYEIPIKQGIYFVDDEAFTATQGKGREVVAEDFVYSFKRIADNKVGSTGWWLFSKRIKGLDAFREASKKSEPTNYDAVVSGLTAKDKYTLRIELNEPYPQLIYALAMSYTVAVPREVVEKHSADFASHPVGTGPFRLERWRRGLRIDLVRNTNYREAYYPSEGQPEDVSAGLLADKGKRLPLADKLVFRIFRESQPLWLNFVKGNLDAAGIPKDSYDDAIDKAGELKPKLKKLGVGLWKEAYPDVAFIGFNMQDPLIGKNRNLRLAISLAYDTQKRIERLYNGRAIVAHGPIPPGISGYDANLKNPAQVYDVEQAKKMLAKAGYPGGKGLPPLNYESVASTTSRQFDELFKRELEAVGISVKINLNTWPELLSKVNKQQAQMFGMAWHADYPDAENLLALFYGPNEAPGVNHANYKNKAFDALYEKVRTMTESKERTELYQKMVKMVIDDVPWIFSVHRINFSLYHNWLKNYKPHPIAVGLAKYYKVDLETKRELQSRF